jgi:hypothetical protein
LFTRPENDLAWVDVESYFDDLWNTPWPLKDLTLELDQKRVIQSKMVEHEKENKEDD